MGRDSFFGERIVWVGRPKHLETPPIFRALAAVLFVSAAASICFAVTAWFALAIAPASLVFFAGWSALMGLGCVYGPRMWLTEVRYVVTQDHVIYQRGRFRRTMDRNAISFARVFWSTQHAGVGDLELVRAVPTGVLRRRLMLRLAAVAAPDRVWAIVRGVASSVPAGIGERPLTQRLDDGERVVWFARPRATARAWLPRGARDLSALGLSLVLFLVLARMIATAVPNMGRLLESGLPASSAAFAALVMGQSLGGGVVAVGAAYLFYVAVIRPVRLARETRYLITNRRVLIQRREEELHLDRSKIVDIIDSPKGHGLSDVFLVLDGPRARALAASGAFGEMSPGPALRPVLESVEDAESVSRILTDEPPISEAA